MTGIHDPELVWLFAGVAGLLLTATVAGRVAAATVGLTAAPTIENANARIRAWWVMTAAFAIAVLTGGVGSVVLFALISFLALREFITLIPTSRADHSALLWCFFLVTPIQYVLVGIQWYGLFSIMIPVYAFLLVPARAVLAGDTERFLERAATIQWGLMACVYCISHAPALLLLDIEGYDGENAKLLFFLVVVVQLSDVFQYLWGKLLGRHRVAPSISPNKTWEGLIGASPVPQPWGPDSGGSHRSTPGRRRQWRSRSQSWASSADSSWQRSSGITESRTTEH